MLTAMLLVTVTLAEALALAEAWLVAVTVITVPGKIAGAIYWPLVEIVPTCALPPATPLTLQVIPRFVEPLTVAWKFTLVPSRGDALAGEMLMVTSGGGGGVPPPPLPLAVPVHPTAVRMIAPSVAITTRMENARACSPADPTRRRCWLRFDSRV
jgi:hypothetical protein